MDMIFPHDWRRKVFHPDAGQRVPANLIVLVGALRVVRDVESDILAIADITEFYVRIGTRTVDTYSCTDWKGSIFLFSKMSFCSYEDTHQLKCF